MHKPQVQLTEVLRAAARQVTVGGLYVHYKDPSQTYKVLRLAIAEADDSTCVIYEAQYGDKIVFVRPLSSWLAQVEHNGGKVPRFAPAA